MMEVENKKGQVAAIIGILFGTVAIFLVAILMSPILEFIDIGVNSSNGSANGNLIAIVFNIIPVFIVIVLLILIIVLILGK